LLFNILFAVVSLGLAESLSTEEDNMQRLIYVPPEMNLGTFPTQINETHTAQFQGSKQFDRGMMYHICRTTEPMLLQLH
jgi:hypothetical protein